MLRGVNEVENNVILFTHESFQGSRAQFYVTKKSAVWEENGLLNLLNTSPATSLPYFNGQVISAKVAYCVPWSGRLFYLCTMYLNLNDMSPRSFLHFLLPVLVLYQGCERTTPASGENSNGGLPAEILGLAGSAEVYTWSEGFKPNISPAALPLPGYFGFIPSDSGHQPEVLLLGKDIPKGRIGILPIALIRCREIERGDTFNMVVAVPFEKSFRTVQAETFRAFLIEYDALKRTVELWVRHAAGYGMREVVRWEDEVVAGQLIRSTQSAGSGK